MGKGTIISGGTDGLYKLNYNADRTRIQEKIDDITAIMDVLTNKDVPALEARVTDAQSVYDILVTELNAAITAKEPTSDIVRDMNLALAALMQIIRTLNSKKAKLASLEQMKKLLTDALPPKTDPMKAWCADLNETLTGEVGTIETPASSLSEKAAGAIIIRPGGTDGTEAVYDMATDGIKMPCLGTSPAGNFFNLAMLPAWMKWQPTYRLGTITFIYFATDTCDVTLDDAVSSVGAYGNTPLNVNQFGALTNVPIVYMSCNSAAFVVGDRVVVKYTGSGPGTDYTPTVIGFETNPKTCAVLGIFIICGRFSNNIYSYIWEINPENDYSVTEVLHRKKHSHASTIDCSNKLIYTFGGRTSSGSLSKLDRLDSFNIETTENIGYTPTPRPAKRDWMDITLDELNQKIYMYGGHGAFGADVDPYDDTWVFDVLTRSWIDISPATNPGKRSRHKMVMDQKNGHIYLFGGLKLLIFPGFEYTNDLWRFDVATRLWTNITPVSSPPGRSLHGMVIDDSYSNIYIHGGSKIFFDPFSTVTYNDLWKYSIVSGLWTNITQVVGNPSARQAHGMSLAGNNIYIYGSLLDQADDVLYIYNTIDDKWTTQTLTPTTPARWGLTMEICAT